MSRHNLPPGTWVEFRFIPQGALPEDIQKVILERTGVAVDLDRIVVYPFDGLWQGAKVSLHATHVQCILKWALMDDTILGQRVEINPYFNNKPRELAKI